MDSTNSEEYISSEESTSSEENVRSEEYASEDGSDDGLKSISIRGLTSTCRICIKIWSCLTDHKSYTLGSFERLLSSGCTVHTPLILAFQKTCSRKGLRNIRVSVHWFSQNGTAGLLERTNWSCGFFFSLAKDQSIPGHTGTARVLDPDWADLTMAKKWKQLCLSEHGDACNDPMRIATTRPAWVVDVQENCVVPGRDCASFVALSYVWGKHSWLRVDMDTLAVLQKPGALFDVPEIATNLAPIVRHAMHFTAVLEERYLWIDALCIVQGDGNVYDQLNSMGSFYASAVVTIVAADGDSQSGLLGLEGVSEPRQVRQEIIPFGEEKLVVGGDFEDGGFASSSYSKRGWTYQEYLMSKRRLIIHNKRLHWECMCHRKHEDSLREDEASETLHDIKRGFPDLEYLDWTVSDYNEREFSYEEDALPGISGLLSNMSRTLTGGFLCGLPEMFFDRALGWVPNNGYTDLRRRIPSEEGQHKTNRAKDPSLTILPSWSWLGWHGEVRLSEHRNSEAVTVDDFWPISEETIPTTEWYTSNDAHGVNLRRIKSSWYENRDILYKDFFRPLPQGWSRVEVETEKSDSESDSDVSKNGIPHELMFPSGCGRYIFKHEKLPHVKWHYPFPVVDFASAAQVMPEQTRYLFCKTHGARLFVSRRVAVSEWILKRNVLLLRLGSVHGEVIGELQVHNDEDADRLRSAVKASVDNPEGHSLIEASVEMVVIYESRVREAEKVEATDGYHRDFWNETYSGNVKTMARYAVLWIEWQDGIAYRKGVGFVEKSAWELAGPKEVDLILG